MARWNGCMSVDGCVRVRVRDQPQPRRARSSRGRGAGTVRDTRRDATCALAGARVCGGVVEGEV